jgi:hypothetical protein
MLLEHTAAPATAPTAARRRFSAQSVPLGTPPESTAQLRRTGAGRSEIRLGNGSVVALCGPLGAFTGEYEPDHLERIRSGEGC